MTATTQPGAGAVDVDGAAPRLGLGAVLERVAQWRQVGKADEAAALLARVLRDPAAARPEVAAPLLQTLADLCLNTFGDARAAGLIYGRMAEAQPGILTDFGAIVTDLYAGQDSPVSIAARMSAVAARHLSAATRPGAAGSGASPSSSRQAGVARSAGRLRIGLISNSWCASPVAFLALGGLREMSRQSELVFFSRGEKADWANQAFRELAHEWHDCRTLDGPRLREQLEAAELDALVDMSGWTDVVALEALCVRPAPRLLKWVGGQAMTTGLPCYDGFVADAWQVPVRSECLYTEPVLRVQQGYVTYTSPPYFSLDARAANPPRPHRARAGHYAIVSNPVKISAATGELLRQLRPKRLYLLDHRWRHRQTRLAAQQRLGSVIDVAEFVTPVDHPAYLEALQALDATVVETAPYSMGMTAIELRLLGKPILQQVRALPAAMCELHCSGHLQASGFVHHAELAGQILGWCRGS